MNDPESVFDPNEESPEFCLDCYAKHSGHGLVLIGEALDRIRQDRGHQNPETVSFIRLHANKAMNELAAAEDHVKHAKTDNQAIKGKLDGLAHEARVIRDKVRRYLKTAPNPQAENWSESAGKIKAGETTPRVDFLLEAMEEATELRDKVDIISSEVGCGDCMAKQEDLDEVQSRIDVLMEKTFKTSLPKLEQKSIPAMESQILQEVQSENPANDLLKNSIIGPFQKEAKKMVEEIKNVPFLFFNDVTTIITGRPAFNLNKKKEE